MTDKPESCAKCPHMRSYQDGYNIDKFIVRCKALDSKKFYDDEYEVSKYKGSVPWWCPENYCFYTYQGGSVDDDMA